MNFAAWAFNYCPTKADSSHQYYGAPDADNLVIFIHGLCGDAQNTWTNKRTHFNFPESLAQSFVKENKPVYILNFDYAGRLQDAPSILSIADHLQFEIGELLKQHPYRTLRIVAHSMGGLVAREYILRRQPRVHPQLKVTNVVLLATPNNGSELAELGQLIPKNRQVEELRHIDRGNTYLESLSKDWNGEFKGAGHPRHLLLYAGYEELSRTLFGKVVTMSSAIPYADESKGFQEDHESIAKPKDTNDLTYRWVKAKLEESLEKTARQLLDGMVQQGIISATDVPQRLPRTVELLTELQGLAGTELEKVLAYVKAGQFQEALALLDASEANESKLVERVAQRRFMQAEIHELRYEMPQAASYYSQAVELAPSNGAFRQRYGWFLIFTGDSRGAIVQFEQTVRLSQTGGNPYLEANALGGLGGAYITLSQYDKAIKYLEQALAMHRKLGDLRDQAKDLGNLGIAYGKVGQYTKASELYAEALPIHRTVGVGSSRVDLQACKLEYSIVSPK